jgi:L-ascorbate metabolism protein UlaG (beta-lactamase superfamily)
MRSTLAHVAESNLWLVAILLAGSSVLPMVHQTSNNLHSSHRHHFIVSHPTPGHVIYHSGDTDVFGDMRIISDLYKPDVALLCIGGHYTMGPQGAAYAIDNVRAIPLSSQSL